MKIKEDEINKANEGSELEDASGREFVRDQLANAKLLEREWSKFQRKSVMYLLKNAKGDVVCGLSDENIARQWAEKFDWSVQQVVNADGKQPVRLRQGFTDLLQPNKSATWGDWIIVFDSEHPSYRPNSSTVEEGDVFYRSNLENFSFAVAEGEDIEVLAMNYWSDLHKRGLDLRRQPDGTFKIIRTKVVSAESPQVPVIRNPVPPNGQ